MFAKLAPRVVQCLVERAAVAVQPLGVHIDRLTVERQRREDNLLMRYQSLGDCKGDRGEELALFSRSRRVYTIGYVPDTSAVWATQRDIARRLLTVSARPPRA